jgi:hypothetical protein
MPLAMYQRHFFCPIRFEQAVPQAGHRRRGALILQGRATGAACSNRTIRRGRRLAAGQGAPHLSLRSGHSRANAKFRR